MESFIQLLCALKEPGECNAYRGRDPYPFNDGIQEITAASRLRFGSRFGNHLGALRAIAFSAPG